MFITAYSFQLPRHGDKQENLPCRDGGSGAAPPWKSLRGMRERERSTRI
jgi:hypothetical protein